jgi:hypothetical protein
MSVRCCSLLPDGDYRGTWIADGDGEALFVTDDGLELFRYSNTAFRSRGKR